MHRNSSSSKRKITSSSEYPCKKCDKTFKTGTALGGHMGAHRDRSDKTKLAAEKEVGLDVGLGHGENRNRPTTPPHFPVNVQPLPVHGPIPGTGCKHVAPAPGVQPRSGEHEQKSTTVLGNPGGGEFGSNKNAVNFKLEYKPELAAEKEVDLELKLGYGENKNRPTARPHFPLNVQPPPVDATIPGTGFNHAAPESAAKKEVDLELKLGYGENKNRPTARPHFPLNVQPPPVDATIPGTGFNHAAPESAAKKEVDLELKLWY